MNIVGPAELWMATTSKNSCGLGRFLPVRIFEHTFGNIIFTVIIGEATVYQRRRIKGSFYERMELNQYPFDTQVCTLRNLYMSCLISQSIKLNCKKHFCIICLQDLTVTATTELGEHEINLLPDESEISTVNVQV